MSAKYSKEDLKKIYEDVESVRGRTHKRMIREELGEEVINRSPESKAFYKWCVDSLRRLLPPEDFTIYYNSRDVSSLIVTEWGGKEYSILPWDSGHPDYLKSYGVLRKVDFWWLNFLRWALQRRGPGTPWARRYVGEWKDDWIMPRMLDEYDEFIFMYEIHRTEGSSHEILFLFRNVARESPPEITFPPGEPKWACGIYDSSGFTNFSSPEEQYDIFVDDRTNPDYFDPEQYKPGDYITTMENNYAVFFPYYVYVHHPYEGNWNHEGACDFYSMYVMFFYATYPTTGATAFPPKPDIYVWMYFVHRLMETFSIVGRNRFHPAYQGRGMCLK